jgi:hypothetical protein
MSTASYDTPYGPVHVTFCFSRHGDCSDCDGTGTIERYRYTNGGRCYRCGGTGGKHPPEGTYHVYRRPSHSDIRDGADHRDLYYLGEVAKTKQGWQTVYGTHSTRTAAALALFQKGKGEHG